MPEQRKQLYIKRSFQQTQILEVMLSTFIIINLIVIVDYFMINNMADVQELKQYLAWTVAGIEVISFIWIYRYNLKTSHRVAGPIYQMERGLKALADGDLSIMIRLRKDDNFHEVGEQMNQTITTLRERISKIQNLLYRIEKEVDNDIDLFNQLSEELKYFKAEPEITVADNEGIDQNKFDSRESRD